MQELDQFVVNIEFLLISVIQGAALATLGTNAVEPIVNLQWIYWPYIGCALLFILLFWAGAIIHSISFIDWPLDLKHNFLYFLLSFTEILAFTQLTKPTAWFGFILLFFIVGGLLYWVDLLLIKKHQKKFSQSIARKQLFDHIYKAQFFELTTIIPLGVIYNLAAFIALITFPEFFIQKNYHCVLISAECLFNFLFLLDIIKNFHKRSELITNTISKK